MKWAICSVLKPIRKQITNYCQHYFAFQRKFWQVDNELWNFHIRIAIFARKTKYIQDEIRSAHTSRAINMRNFQFQSPSNIVSRLMLRFYLHIVFHISFIFQGNHIKVQWKISFFIEAYDWKKQQSRNCVLFFSYLHIPVSWWAKQIHLQATTETALPVHHRCLCNTSIRTNGTWFSSFCFFCTDEFVSIFICVFRELK